MNLFVQLGIGVTIFCLVALLVLFLQGYRTRPAGQRMLLLTGRPGSGPSSNAAHHRLQEKALGISRLLRAKLGFAENERLAQRFTRAGLRSSGHREIYFAARMLGPVVGILAGSFIPKNTFMWIVVLTGVAYMAPDFILDRMIRRRRARIAKSIPDAIDLLVICVDAGLGLDQAMLRVGVELAVSHPEVNQEFLQINREQRAGKPRVAAWESMGERTQLPDIAAFVSMLVQTERFGTPIAKALSTFSDGLRMKRRQRAEEMAAKTTVKMLFPLVLFIFPSMFIVLLGPAVISISRGLAAMR